MNYKKGLLVIFLLITSNILIAQTEDYGTWTSIGVEKKFEKWNFNGETELRTLNNATQVNLWNLKLESTYSLFKALQVGAGYEFIEYHDTKYSDYQPRHKAYIFFQGKYKIGRFALSLRERTQVTKKDDSDRIKKSGKINTYKINPEWTWRNRLKLSYDIPKIPVTPSLSVESFYQLNNSDGNTFDNLRYIIALNYNINKHHQFEVYGLLNHEINVTNPTNTYITGIGYVFSF